jgi:hypothetical protein
VIVGAATDVIVLHFVTAVVTEADPERLLVVSQTTFKYAPVVPLSLNCKVTDVP